jgi:hypothetical protein
MVCRIWLFSRLGCEVGWWRKRLAEKKEGVFYLVLRKSRWKDCGGLAQIQEWEGWGGDLLKQTNM